MHRFMIRRIVSLEDAPTNGKNAPAYKNNVYFHFKFIKENTITDSNLFKLVLMRSLQINLN